MHRFRIPIHGDKKSYIKMFWWAFILAFHVFLVFLIQKRSQKAFSNSKNILIVIAHPDDECMFFGPAILYLIGKGLSVHLLCLSIG
jgi:N-acetylglucosaminylphosphatidylinositol deacetylase